MLIIHFSRKDQSVYTNSVNLSAEYVNKNLAEKDEYLYEVAYVTDEVFSYIKSKLDTLNEQNKKLYIRLKEDLYVVYVLDTRGATYEEEGNKRKIKIRESLLLAKVTDYAEDSDYEEMKAQYLN